MNAELQNIKEFFTERRKRCLSVKRLEEEAGMPKKSLDHFLANRRLLSLEHLDKLIPILVDFGYKPVNESQFL